MPQDTGFPERLKASREKAGLSIRDAAVKAGQSPADWGRWEAGDSIPDFTPGVRVAESLGVDALWLALGEEATQGALA